VGILQNFDWEKFLWAVLFGGLGYLARSALNLISSRAEKRLEFGLDVRKDQERSRLANALQVSQVCSDLQDVIVRLFDLMRHARVKSRESYTKSILLETLGLFISRLRILKSLNIALVLYDRDVVNQLRVIIHDIEQYFSDQGFLREYQEELAEYIITSEYARINRSMVEYHHPSQFPSTASFEAFAVWCDAILRNFQSESLDETRLSLEDKDIQLPRILDPGGTLRRHLLDKRAFEFISLLQRLYCLLDNLQDRLLKVYRL